MKTTYLSCAETAKLVRAALKRSFPGVKFSVRSSVYAGGASIDVNWTDGPCSKAVEPVATQFKGGNFDGMIDLKTNHSSWLMPDGTACIATDEGTTGSMGIREATRNWMPDPEAKLVHFGADFIFCTRHLSAALLGRARDRLAAKGLPVETIAIREHNGGGAYIETLTYDREATRGFDMQRELYTAAHNTHCVAAQ